MKMTRSGDTPTDARCLAISFRFSEYSFRGTCCWEFLSRRTKEKHTTINIQYFVMDQPIRWLELIHHIHHNRIFKGKPSQMGTTNNEIKYI